jgi:hypothetical protein
VSRGTIATCDAKCRLASMIALTNEQQLEDVDA